jgi:SAM-dependent methyltransferase
MGSRYGETYAAEQIARDENPVRRAVRSVYLRTLRGLTEGPVCDLGCGAGSFLRYAPRGSVGLDVNPHAVAYCRARGLDALVYDAVEDGFQLTPLAGRDIGTLLLNHVLEHFSEPMAKLRPLLRAAKTLGVRRVVIVTPGTMGFAADGTHRTHIDARFYREAGAFAESQFHLRSLRYFPLPFRWGGDVFLYNELRAVLSIAAGSAKTHLRPSR